MILQPSPLPRPVLPGLVQPPAQRLRALRPVLDTARRAPQQLRLDLQPRAGG